MSVHRFVHLGDLHLGPNSRNADRIAALDQAIAENILQPVAAWLFPGDLNHGRMAIEDKNVLVARITRMADHAPVVICYGNHDLPGDLDFLAKLHAVWPIFVIARPQVLEVPLATGGNAAIFVLPYPTRAGLVSAGVASGSLVDAARQALDVIFMAAAAELQTKAAEGYVPLMIGHVNVAGSIVSTGQPNIGQEIELDPTLMARLGPTTYRGLNHIHKHQIVGTPGESAAVYPGSLCRLDWGEVESKLYLTVEIADDQDLSPVITNHYLDVAPMYHVEGTLDRNGFHFERPMLGWPGQQPQGFAGCEVRVRYRFNANEKSALDEAIVRAPFEGAKRLELDPIAVRERASRAPEVSAAVTLADKVQAFVRRSGIEWNPGMERKFAALQQPDGAAFLTEVQQSLSASRQADPLFAAAPKEEGTIRHEPDDHAAARADADTPPRQEVLL